MKLVKFIKMHLNETYIRVTVGGNICLILTPFRMTWSKAMLYLDGFSASW